MLVIAVAMNVQAGIGNLWKPVTDESLRSLPKVRRNSEVSRALYYELDLQQLKIMLQAAPVRGQLTGLSPLIISFPVAMGGFQKFRVMESPIMADELAAKYPMIKTYAAQGIDDPTAFMRFSVTQFGLHTMTLSGKTPTNFIDPYTEDRKNYIVYDRRTLKGSSYVFECLTEEDNDLPSMRNNTSSSITNNADDQTLRTYRLAQSCNAEYGNIFALTPGQEKADIQAQMAITINRVNGVYERDLAVTMQFVPNNDTLIFYGNTGTDPWNGEFNTTTAQTIDARIGVANYDIGHNFNTSGGGNAGCIACVCLSTSQTGTHKGRGMTGSPNPTGDPFDIDYVAHEMGHQFGGWHTMNTCSRSGSGNTEVEPASASSIMGYAGICPTNIQPNSDDDFNYVNVRDITLNIQTGASSTCSVNTLLVNNPPTADAGADYIIPKSTAFILEGSATDADGLASLTYNWSQNDPAQSPGNGAPQPTYAIGPLYRSISPQTSPNRYMPTLASVIAGNLTPQWEVTPSVARTMNFSFIVRDNDVLGGQTASDLMLVTVSGTAGPFTVTSQNSNVTWNAGANETVTWNVAGTNTGAVNCPNVNIYLSVDGGYTYPYTLASNVPNNGSAIITVPVAATTSTARVMVRGAGNIFYALNGANFSVQAAEFVMNVATASQSICPPTNVDYTFTYNTFIGFTDTTTFSATGNPAGTTVTFNPATAVTDNTPVTMTVSGLTTANIGNYSITITGTSATVTKSTNVSLNVLDPVPAVATLLTPTNGATGIATVAALTWAAASSPGVLYDVEVATDPAFTNIIATATGLTSSSYVTPPLVATTTYYWRIRAYNSCGTALISAAWSFTTNACLAQASANIPVSISPNGTPTITSTLSIPLTGTVNDVNVVGLVGVHSYMGDLNFSLTSPQGTNIPLFGNICGTDEDFDLNLDDAAAPGALPCPPVGGGTYQPQTALSTFNGQPANGTWTLTVFDDANLDGGSLDGWGLEICINTSTGIVKYETSSSVTIFPNPTEGIFTITVKGQDEKYTLEITNALGQILESTSINGNTNNQFDLSKYSAGVYVVNVIGKNMTEQRKITVTHN